MTVLVTGGAGYIGSHMVHALVDAGERVVVLDNLSTGFEWAVPKGVSLDVGEYGRSTARGSVDRGAPGRRHHPFRRLDRRADWVRDPLGYYRNNTVNSRALIETAVAGGVRHFIFSSTAAVYGNPARVPVREDDPTVPTSPYGSSKLMTEIMLRDAGAAHGLRHLILRYFNVAGADPLGRTGQSTEAPPTSSRSGSKRRSDDGRKWKSSAPTIGRRTAPASAIIFTCPIWCAHMPTHWPICAAVACPRRSIAATAAAFRCSK